MIIENKLNQARINKWEEKKNKDSNRKAEGLKEQADSTRPSFQPKEDFFSDLKSEESKKEASFFNAESSEERRRQLFYDSISSDLNESKEQSILEPAFKKKLEVYVNGNLKDSLQQFSEEFTIINNSVLQNKIYLSEKLGGCFHYPLQPDDKISLSAVNLGIIDDGLIKETFSTQSVKVYAHPTQGITNLFNGDTSYAMRICIDAQYLEVMFTKNIFDKFYQSLKNKNIPCPAYPFYLGDNILRDKEYLEDCMSFFFQKVIHSREEDLIRQACFFLFSTLNSRKDQIKYGSDSFLEYNNIKTRKEDKPFNMNLGILEEKLPSGSKTSLTKYLISILKYIPLNGFSSQNLKDIKVKELQKFITKLKDYKKKYLAMMETKKKFCRVSKSMEGASGIEVDQDEFPNGINPADENDKLFLKEIDRINHLMNTFIHDLDYIQKNFSAEYLELYISRYNLVYANLKQRCLKIMR